MARRDYFYDAEAPKPNSIRPAAAVALFDSRGNILLLRRKDNDKWTMPGGTLDFGESLTDCAIREVHEETGLQIRITGLIGTYTDPHILIAYSDGEVRQEFTFVYAAEIEFCGSILFTSGAGFTGVESANDRRRWSIGGSFCCE